MVERLAYIVKWYVNRHNERAYKQTSMLPPDVTLSVKGHSMINTNKKETNKQKLAVPNTITVT